MLILSHGNASVDRGFSLNKEVLVVNKQEKSLIVLIDAMNEVGGIEQVVTTKSLTHYYKNPHAKYKESLDKEKNKNATKRKKTKRRRSSRKE